MCVVIAANGMNLVFPLQNPSHHGPLLRAENSDVVEACLDCVVRDTGSAWSKPINVGLWEQRWLDA